MSAAHGDNRPREHPSTDPHRGTPHRAARLPRLLLRLASLLVPRPNRRRWLDEWNAELWVLEHRSGGERGAPSPLRLSLGAVPHSLWKRKEWAAQLLLQDVRFAARALTRSPGFTTLALITMALGIGANTTIFSMANATLLRAPDGIDDPQSVVQLGRDRPDQGFDNMAYPWFRDFRDRAEGLDALAAYTSRSLVMGRGGDATVLNGQLVTGDYFAVLGVDAQPGRVLSPDDDGALGNPVAVISHGLWTRRFGADPAVVGRRIDLNGSDFEVVGVAERGFQGTDVVSSATDVWIPLSTAGMALGPMYAEYDDRGFSWLWMVGRLTANATPTGLAAELSSMYAAGYEQAYDEPPDHTIGVIAGVGLRPDERDAVQLLMATLMAVVALVLAVACANLANLLLARGIARSRELGIRTALGAARGRLVRELLTESVLLALGGGMLALLITYWSAGLIPMLLPVSLAVSFEPDLQVFGFAVGISLAAGMVFGLPPALRSSQANVVDALNEASPLVGRRGGWMRGGLVMGQLALSFVLLAVTGLLVQSLWRASATDPGYNTRNVMAVTVGVGLAGYDQARGEQFFAALAEGAAGLPGIESAAMASNLPFAGWSRQGVYLPQDRPEFERPLFEIDTASVDANFFETLQIPLLSGEGFNASNSGAEMPPVVLISESAARFLWPGEDAVGKYLPLTAARIPAESMRVIGVVGDVQVRSLRQPPRPAIYVPSSQRYDGTMTLFVRAAGDPLALARPLRALVEDLGPDLGVLRMDSLHDRMGRSLSDTLTVARLGGIFGVLAVVLAAVGLYGVVSYVASSRSHEVGVRMSLGARRADVVGLFLRQALVLAAGGVVLGALLTMGAGGMVAGFLYGVSASDPATLSSIAIAVVALALLAAAIPALRASRASPVTALRRH